MLETQWDTAEGSVRVIDTMPPRGAAADVVRVVEGIRGRVPMRMELRLRFDYGHIVPWVRKAGGDLVAVAGPDAAWLSTPVTLEGRNLTTYADFTVEAGQRVPFVLTYHRSHLRRPTPVEPDLAIARTEQFWSEWIERFDYDGQWSDAVRRSLVVLKGLTYRPTGGIVAGDPADLQIMYGIDGTRRLPEYTLDWLSGYEGAKPVRVGNAASDQFQLDVWGEVLDGLHLSRQAGLAPDASAWRLQKALLDFLECHWDDPDNGLWEIRGERRHFVHSKVLAWAGVDRGVQAVERFGLDGPLAQWKELRERIHADVCAKGFDRDRGTFTQFYGSEGLDAALLLLPTSGFLPWHDPRVVGTVRAVKQHLYRDGFLLRYDTTADGGVDGLPGDEATFLACTFWLVQALDGIGQRAEAVALFERLLALRNDVGLLSEEYDTVAGRLVGNVPQAYSHVGLINAARQLSLGEPAARDPRRTEQEVFRTEAARRSE